MNKIIKTLCAIIFFSSSLILFAETPKQQDVQRQIDEIMKARDEMIKSLFNDSAFDNFDKQFEDLVKRFDKDSFGKGSGFGMDAGEAIGEYDWRETATHQIFALKVKQSKDKPLDIKIEKGEIKLKGNVESIDSNIPKTKKITKVHFEKTFSIPEGVDQNNPEFENKSGELLIKFKKLKTSKVTPKLEHIKPIEDRLPIGKDTDDISI